MRTVYLIGYPGAGKSTLLRSALTEVYGDSGWVGYPHPVRHYRYRGGRAVWEIGVRRDTFPGTDGLSMNVNPHAIRWVQSLAVDDGPTLLVGEGDRLANLEFLRACPDLTVVHVTVPVDEARRRAFERAGQLGVRTQAESWWKGRVTKTVNLAAAVTTAGIALLPICNDDPEIATHQLATLLRH